MNLVITTENTLHRSPEPELTAELFILSYQHVQQIPDRTLGAEKALQKQGPEHNSKLAQIHVMLFGIAVDHERQQEHVLKQRICQPVMEK